MASRIRWELLIVTALGATALVASIGAGTARSQDPANPDDDDDDGSGRGSAGSDTLVAPANPLARPAWVKERFEGALATHAALAKAKIGYYAVDLSTSTVLASRDADAGFNLASNTKLLTSIAALRGLGGGFRWRTTVYANKPPDDTGMVDGDLYVRGRGDPVLLVSDLRQLAHDVAGRGVRTVKGRLVVDASYFDNVYDPPHFDEQPKEHASFRAPIASFGVQRSAYTVTVMPEPIGPPKITIEPDVGNYLKLTKSEVTCVPEGRTRLRLEPTYKRNQIAIELTGQIRIGAGSWNLRRRVADPARYAARVFQQALADEGVRLRSRAIAFGTVPLAAKVIAHHDSPNLADVLRLMNKHSDNYIAESVLKTLGAEAKGDVGATWADGVAAVKKRLLELGMVGEYRADNGSGLFSATSVSPKQLVTLLRAAHADYRIGPDLVGSLPVGGLDGTLARRWHGKPARGRVRAKTGTLASVITLSGYVGVDGNHLVAFAILVNDVPRGRRNVARTMSDEMVDALAAYLDAH